MKSLIELLLAWLLGTILPLLVYFQMIFWLMVADCSLGTFIAIRDKSFTWRKFFSIFAKGAALALLLIAFNQIQLALHIPSITIGTVEFNVSMFLAGIMARNEVVSLDSKTEILWNFSFLKPLLSRFSGLKEFEEKS